MDIHRLAVITMLLPSLTMAADHCGKAETTVEINRCVYTQVEVAEKELGRYLEESRRRFAGEPKTLVALDKAHQVWLEYRQAHCDAIYEMWLGGTVSDAERGYCLLEQTRRRTRDLWKSYLTYVDRTPSILPDPKAEDEK